MRENLITKKEAAARLGVSVRTFERLVRQGKLRIICISIRCIRVAPQEIDRFIKQREGGL